MFGIKTKVKIVKKYLQLLNVFHCLGFICLNEPTQVQICKFVAKFLISEAVTYVT